MLKLKKKLTQLKILSKTQKVFESTVKKPYVQHLRQFFLKVHPDFFGDNKKQQDINQKSFQQLNEILNWVKEIEEKKEIPNFQNKTKLKENLKFYCKFSDKTIKLIESKFEIKEFHMNNMNKIIEAIDETIISLLQKSNIISSTENFRRNFNKKKSAKELREELRLALKETIENRNLENLKHGWIDEEEIPSVEELIENKMVFISEDLTIEETMKGIENLQKNIDKMEFYKWKNLPLMISSNKIQISNNYFTVPFDFMVKDVLKFLKEHFENEENEEIQKRKDLTNKAAEFQKLEESSNLKCFKLEFKTHYDKSIECLKRLNELENQNLFENISLEILEDEYRISPTGKISIPWNFKQGDLFKFLNFIGKEKISKIKVYNELSNRILEETKNLGIEIIHKLNFKTIDVKSTSHHPVDILNFLKFLKENYLYLSKYDWSLYSLKLTKKSNIRITDNVIYLPIEFSIPNLLLEIQTYRDEKLKNNLPPIEGDDEDDEIVPNENIGLNDKGDLFEEEKDEDDSDIEMNDEDDFGEINDEDEYGFEDWNLNERTRMKYSEFK
eukprot:gene11061-3769_t